MAFDPGTELGPRLRQVREQRGLSARGLARRIQCSPSLISPIERGLSSPSGGMLYSPATELRPSLDFFFSAAAPAEGPAVTAHGGRHRRAGPAGASLRAIRPAVPAGRRRAAGHWRAAAPCCERGRRYAMGLPQQDHQAPGAAGAPATAVAGGAVAVPRTR